MLIGIVIFISYYGHPERSDKSKKREEFQAIFRYLAGAGHPYVIGGISMRSGKKYRT